MTKHKKNLTPNIRYKGVGGYYKGGAIGNIQINYKERYFWGEIEVKLTGEKINTYFGFDSKEIVWENPEEKN